MKENNRIIIAEMLSIYGNFPIDWMGYPITKKNRLTYHHIDEKCNGGQATIENGALITRLAHEDLNEIAKINIKLYIDYNFWFKQINDAKCPPTEELRAVMSHLKALLETALNGRKSNIEQIDSVQTYDKLQEMIKIFRPREKDWMGYLITENNPLTYRHIISPTEGGQTTVENGALLTTKAQKLLNSIMINDTKLYSEYLYWFDIINKTRRPPTNEVRSIIKSLKTRLNANGNMAIKKAYPIQARGRL